MNTNNILADPVFAEAPPVLVDVGASGGAPEMWQALAPYSVYVGFDADDRKTEFTEAGSDGYRRKVVYHRAVVADDRPTVTIHLTRSPYCSSTLKPAWTQLGRYAFRHLFAVESQVDLPATTLEKAMRNLGQERIDFLKIDTQGTDLRIFESLSPQLADKVLAVEMEPGLIPVYEGEDLAWNALSRMPARGFWLAQFDVRHTSRADSPWFDGQGYMVKRFPEQHLGRAPGWSNLLFLSEPRPGWTYREWVLAIYLAEYFNHRGAALALCDQAIERGVGGKIPAIRGELWRSIQFQGALRSLPRLPRALLGIGKRWLLARMGQAK